MIVRSPSLIWWNTPIRFQRGKIFVTFSNFGRSQSFSHSRKVKPNHYLKFRVFYHSRLRESLKDEINMKRCKTLDYNVRGLITCNYKHHKKFLKIGFISRRWSQIVWNANKSHYKLQPIIHPLWRGNLPM